MRFLVNSNAVKKMALTTQERDIDTPRPLVFSTLSSREFKPFVTSVHAAVEELHFRSASFVSATSKTVALIDAFHSIDWKDLIVV